MDLMKTTAVSFPGIFWARECDRRGRKKGDKMRGMREGVRGPIEKSNVRGRERFFYDALLTTVT